MFPEQGHPLIIIPCCCIRTIVIMGPMDHQKKKRKKKLLQASPQIHRQNADMDGYFTGFFQTFLDQSHSIPTFAYSKPALHSIAFA
jgi:hypothetical protein